MASWEWKAKDAWTPYDHKANKKIIKAAKNGKTSVEITLPSGAKYMIDLVNNRQIQKNAPTKTRRVRYNDGSLPRTKPKTVKKVTETTTVVTQAMPMATQTTGGNMFYTSGVPGPVVSTVTSAPPMQAMSSAHPQVALGAPQPQFAPTCPGPSTIHTQAPPAYYNPQFSHQPQQQPYPMTMSYTTSSQFQPLPQHADPAMAHYQQQQAITATGVEWNQQTVAAPLPPGY